MSDELMGILIGTTLGFFLSWFPLFYSNKQQNKKDIAQILMNYDVAAKITIPIYFNNYSEFLSTLIEFENTLVRIRIFYLIFNAKSLLTKSINESKKIWMRN